MKKVLVVAPHPDDETLGCGGTLLRHYQEGDEVHWLIVTDMKGGFNKEKINLRKLEIEEVGKNYQFKSITQLDFSTTTLDEAPMRDLVTSFSEVVQIVKPEIVYLPYRGDVHSDHKYVFDAMIACTKWFRYDFIKKILVYETLSETEFGINPDNNGFKPNVYVNITDYFNKKIQIMNIFSSEMGDYPFPRSNKAIEALASYRGVSGGFHYAEAFMLLKEVY
ncbi:PIG-L deacetylase family protein [Virgibacillus byunsanensis]|uniref:PIG-L deacetylase family protein n=1 Tax=Virgibacillus byunsanensis TaxID=570945 RepID=A0ABW3LGF2_9BACI